MSIKEIKLGGIGDRYDDTHGFVAVDSYEGKANWGITQPGGPQPTIEEAIEVARRYGWGLPFFIAEVNIVAKVVE